MKNIKRLLILQFLLLFVIPITLGEISITLPEKDVYNLGDKIVPTVSVKEDQDYEGLFSLHIICDDYELQYFKTPLSLEEGFRNQLNVPALTLSKPILGDCNLKSSFDSIDGENIAVEESDDFKVTDELNIAVSGNLEVKPGEEIVLLGEVKKYDNKLLSKGEVDITFRSNEFEVEVEDGKFKHTIRLNENVETGNVPLLVVVRDKYGNYGDKTLNLNIVPMPTRIKNVFENNVVTLGDNLKVKVTLYDHLSKVINGSNMNVKIFDFDENLIAESDVPSSSSFEFNTDEKPVGTYTILSSFENIKQQDSFTIVKQQDEIGVAGEDNSGGIFSSITGAVVDGVGYVVSRPTLAGVILILITLGTIGYFSKDFIIGRVRRKKDTTENLFEDFEFKK